MPEAIDTVGDQARQQEGMVFIQVFQGKVSDPGAIRSRLERWERELGASATGWLGLTAGVTPGGDFIAMVRFADEESARRNSDRPEQGAWWAETEKVFRGEVEFHDYAHTALYLEGGSDDAGFVQMLQGRYTGSGSPGDISDNEQIAELRPDMIGGVTGWDHDRHFTEAVYFTSEEAAREGERRMGEDPQVSKQMEEWAATVEGLRFFDLTDPWMRSP